jgi:hypothetical protein
MKIVLRRIKPYPFSPIANSEKKEVIHLGNHKFDTCATKQHIATVPFGPTKSKFECDDCG